MIKSKIRTKSYPYYFLLPAIVIYFVFYLLPTILGFGYSFTDWNAYGEQIHFVAFSQFKKVFEDPVIWICFKNTMFYAIGTAFLQNFFALALAILIDHRIKLAKAYRALFFFPAILTPLIVGYVFQGIFQYDGIFNAALSFLGFGDVTVAWLGDARYSMIIVILVAVWYGTGLHMTIYLAALQGVPEDIIEAAKLDGATNFQTLIFVKLKLITAGFTVNIIYSIINSLKVFGIVFVLTGGGPGRATAVFNTYIFENFSEGMFGYASAIGTVSFLMICLIAFPVMYYLKRKEG